MEKLIESYIRDELEGTELAEFESQLLYDKDLLEAVMAADNLKEGMKTLAENDDSYLKLARVTTPHKTTVASNWMKFAMAASITAMVIVPNVFMYQELNQANEKLALVDQLAVPQVNVPELVISPMRSVNQGSAKVVEFAPSSHWQRVTVELAPPTANTYNLEIKNEAGDQVVYFGSIVPTPFDTVSVLMPSSALTDGSYEISVSVSGDKLAIIKENITIIHSSN